ncbi:MAG: TetR/AcrR family transcriptional regulator [Parvibaculaceae bacterium]
MGKPAREALKAKKQAYIRDEILTSAEELFAQRGIRAVTIDDIAGSLGYTKSIIYYYFKNKNQLLWEIFCRIHDAWWEDMASLVGQGLPPDELLSAMIRKHALNVMEKTTWTAIYFRDEGELSEAQQKIVSQRKRKYTDLFKNVYRQGVENGVFKDISASLAANSIIGLCNWTHVWFKETGKLSPNEIAGFYVMIAMRGCLVNPGAE